MHGLRYQNENFARCRNYQTYRSLSASGEILDGLLLSGTGVGSPAPPARLINYGPFATQTIPATVNEAPYILDGLLMNETGKRIKEQYADTGGFTDHVFGITSILVRIPG